MPLPKTKTFIHQGRTFEILAETHSDPCYVEAVVFEGSVPANVVFPGGRVAVLNCGASLLNDFDPEGELTPEDEALVDHLIETAEANFRQLSPGPVRVKAA